MPNTETWRTSKKKREKQSSVIALTDTNLHRDVLMNAQSGPVPNSPFRCAALGYHTLLPT